MSGVLAISYCLYNLQESAMKSTLNCSLAALVLMACNSVTAAQPATAPYPIGIKHLTIQRPGQPPENRIIDGKYWLTYDAVLVKFDKPPVVTADNRVVHHTDTPVDIDKAIGVVAGGGSFQVLRRPNISTADKEPSVIGGFQETAVPVVTVSGNTKTTGSITVSLGLELVVDPVILDAAVPDNVRSRAYLTHTDKPNPPNGSASTTARANADDQLKVGDVQVLTWALNGEYYGVALRLDSISDTEKPSPQ